MTLFDVERYELPIEEQPIYMGEQPPMGRNDWLRICAEREQEGNYVAADEAFRKADRAQHFPQVLGQLTLDNL